MLGTIAKARGVPSQSEEKLSLAVEITPQNQQNDEL
jgi:hypothetical protein